MESAAAERRSGGNPSKVPRRQWDEQLADYVRFVREHKRIPSQYAQDPVERKLTSWLRHQKSSLRNGLLLPERAAMLEKVLPGWSSPNRVRPSWDQWLARTVEFTTVRGRWPSAIAADDAERSLANWLYRQRATRTVNRDRDHAQRMVKLKRALPGWPGGRSPGAHER